MSRGTAFFICRQFAQSANAPDNVSEIAKIAKVLPLTSVFSWITGISRSQRFVIPAGGNEAHDCLEATRFAVIFH